MDCKPEQCEAAGPGTLKKSEGQRGLEEEQQVSRLRGNVQMLECERSCAQQATCWYARSARRSLASGMRSTKTREKPADVRGIRAATLQALAGFNAPAVFQTPSLNRSASS